jgi:prevent-host-death family protein
MAKKPMVRTVTATEAQNRFGALIRRAYADEEHLIVERGGIPVVAIVPMQDYERLVASEHLPEEVADDVAVSSKAAAARARLKAFLDEVHAQMSVVPDDEVNEDIREAIATVRQRQ